MKTLIIGCGYVGLRLGQELTSRGHTVWGMRRDPAAAHELEESGIRPVIADVADPATLQPPPADFEWVVNCASAGASSTEAYRRTYEEGNRNAVAWLSARAPQKYVYTSSTGVYPQNDGSVVDESSMLLADSGTPGVLVRAEQLLLSAVRTHHFPAVILRVAGIYGPGRGYWLRQFLSGSATLEGNGRRHLNMVHRDDVAAAIIAALEKGRPGQVYNVVDNDPPEQLEVFKWLSDRLDRPLQKMDGQSSGFNRRQTGNKIISNLKIRSELGWAPRFPTFREGYEEELQGLGYARKDPSH